MSRQAEVTTMKANQENEHVHKGTTMEVQKITLYRYR